MKKKTVYKIEASKRTKGWTVTIYVAGGNDEMHCFSTTKSMTKFVTKIAEK